MKKLTFIIYCTLWLSCCIACSAKEDKNTFVFKGRIGGMGRQMHLVYVDSSGKYAHCNIALENEQFHVEFKLPEPQVVEVNCRRLMKMVGNGFVPCNSGSLLFVAIPGQTLEVNGDLKKDFVDLYPGGDAENDIFREYTSQMHPIENESVNLMITNWTDSTLTTEEKAANLQKMERLENEMQRIRMDFLQKYVSSVGGLWLLEDMLQRTQLTMEEAERFFSIADKKYEKLTYYKNIATRIQGAKATEVGQLVPTIKTSRTYDGKPFDLAEYKGKYVLIDFWGTWCGACISGMPQMKKFAEKHADKLVLLGIAKDNRETWEQYLSKSEWNWKQIVAGEGEEDYVVRFNVQGFPTKILIGPDGKILKRTVGEDPAFYEELEHLMK